MMLRLSGIHACVIRGSKLFWKSPLLKPWRLTLGLATALACASFWPRFWLPARHQSLKPWNGLPSQVEDLGNLSFHMRDQSVDEMTRLPKRQTGRAVQLAVAPISVKLDAVIQPRLLCRVFTVNRRREVSALIMALFRPTPKVQSVHAFLLQICVLDRWIALDSNR